jgi:hypothetical protein
MSEPWITLSRHRVKGKGFLFPSNITHKRQSTHSCRSERCLRGGNGLVQRHADQSTEWDFAMVTEIILSKSCLSVAARSNPNQ